MSPQSSRASLPKRPPGAAIRSTNEKSVLGGGRESQESRCHRYRAGAYALDENALAAAKRLRARRPNAEIWFVRVNHRALHWIGRRHDNRHGQSRP